MCQEETKQHRFEGIKTSIVCVRLANVKPRETLWGVMCILKMVIPQKKRKGKRDLCYRFFTNKAMAFI